MSYLEAVRVALRDCIVNGVVQSAFVPRQIRGALLRPFGVTLGKSRMEGRGFVGRGPLRVGECSYINYGCFLDPSAGIDRKSVV